MRTLVNGELRQEAPISALIFGVRRLISTLSEVMTLEPGDVIATGTPAGICTIDSSESSPSRRSRGTGTPMTGSGVSDAVMPGRCAAPPTPAVAWAFEFTEA